jgi:hypothetical protein
MDEPLTIRLSKADRAKLDEVRGSQTASAAIRNLIRQAVRSSNPPTHAEALQYLREQAQAGKVAAAIHLEKLTQQDEMLEEARRITASS